MSKRARSSFSSLRSTSSAEGLLYFAAPMTPVIREFAYRLGYCAGHPTQQQRVYYDIMETLAASPELPVPHAPFSPAALPRQYVAILSCEKYVPHVLDKIIQVLEAVRLLANSATLRDHAFRRRPLIVAIADFLPSCRIDFTTYLNEAYGASPSGKMKVYLSESAVAADAVADADTQSPATTETDGACRRPHEGAYEESREIDAYGLTGFAYFAAF